MIDTFALALTHGLMLLAAWRLVSRADLDLDSVSPLAGGSGRGWAGKKSSDPAIPTPHSNPASGRGGQDA